MAPLGGRSKEAAMRLQSIVGFFGVRETPASTAAEQQEARTERRSWLKRTNSTQSTSSPKSIASSQASRASTGRRSGSKDSRSGSKEPRAPCKERDLKRDPYGAESKLTEQSLEQTMEQVSDNVKVWEEEHGFQMVNSLQEAIRNHGRVDLMRLPEADGGTEVAVKRMPNRWVRASPRDFNSQYPTASERPWTDMGIVKYLNTVHFPYACELIDVFRDQENTYVASSLASEGDLFSWCHRDPKPGKGREESMPAIVCQIFTAVRWLHELGIAHRDLSLENILLVGRPPDARVKIIDFGMSTLSRMCKNEVRGKQSYQAPEMHLRPEYDAFCADAFAIGVVLFSMAAQDYPWTSTQRNECQLFEYVSMFGFRKFLEKRRLKKGAGVPLISVFSPAFSDLLEGLLQTRPADRLTMGESVYAAVSERHCVWESQWIANAVDAGLLPWDSAAVDHVVSI